MVIIMIKIFRSLRIKYLMKWNVDICVIFKEELEKD